MARSGDEPGIRRRRCGRGFTYLDVQGKTIYRPQARERFNALAIPPAICRDYYIHPAVIEAYEEGTFFDMVQEASEQSANGTADKEEDRQVEGQVVLHLLRHHLA